MKTPKEIALYIIAQYEKIERDCVGEVLDLEDGSKDYLPYKQAEFQTITVAQIAQAIREDREQVREACAQIALNRAETFSYLQGLARQNEDTQASVVHMSERYACSEVARQIGDLNLSGKKEGGE